MQYKKKPVLTEATQWFRNGDHPQDRSLPIDTPSGNGRLSEGQVVKFFRSTNIPGGRFCPECGNVMQHHGIMETVNGEEIVHPSDYILQDRKGNFYRLPAVEFEAMYEPYEVTPTPPPKVEA